MPYYRQGRLLKKPSMLAQMEEARKGWAKGNKVVWHEGRPKLVFEWLR